MKTALILAGVVGAWWYFARQKAQRTAGTRAPKASAPVAPKSPPTLDTAPGTGSGASIYTPPEEIAGSGFGELSSGVW